MSDEGERDDGDDRDERDDADSEESADERTDDSRGFSLRAGLQPISDMLGSFIEVTKTDAPPRSEGTVEWEYVEEDDEEGEDDFRSRSRDRKLSRSSDSKREQDDTERQRPTDAERRESGDSRRERRKRTRPIDARKVLSDTRREGDEFVVTADIYGINKDDLSVGIDPRRSELVVGANDTALDRVALPWESAEATSVRYNNGVLVVRLRSKEA